MTIYSDYTNGAFYDCGSSENAYAKSSSSEPIQANYEDVKAPKLNVAQAIRRDGFDNLSTQNDQQNYFHENAPTIVTMSSTKMFAEQNQDDEEEVLSSRQYNHAQQPDLSPRKYPVREKKRSFVDFATSQKEKYSIAKRAKNELQIPAEQQAKFDAFSDQMDQVADAGQEFCEYAIAEQADWAAQKASLAARVNQLESALSHTRNVLSRLYNNPLVSDISFKVKNKLGQIVELHASSVILETWTPPPLGLIFKHLLEENQKQVKNIEYSYEELEVFLTLGYGKVVDVTADNILEMVTIASKHKLTILSSQCANFFVKHLGGLETEFSMEVFYKLLPLTNFTHSGFTFTPETLAKALNHPLLRSINVSALMSLISLGSLIYTPTPEEPNRRVAWRAAMIKNWLTMDKEPSNKTPENIEVLRNWIGFEKRTVDFLLTFNSFCWLLFTSDEISALIKKINQNK